MKEGWDGKHKDEIQRKLKAFGRASFELSGYRTSKRQWENIERFSKLIKKCSSGE